MRSVRNINHPEDLPELGTTEAAVQSCVSLIAGMCEQPEVIMAYWLDLYWFVRRAYEQEHGDEAPVIIRAEDLLPALRRLWAEVTAVPTPEGDQHGEESKAAAPEAKAAGAATKTAAEKPKRGPRADITAFKSETWARLHTLRKHGLATTARLQAVSGGKLTDAVILDILEGKPSTPATYEALAKALDKIEEQEKGVSREHETTDAGPAGPASET